MRAAVVFDMDGVLADTERLKLRAHQAAARALGGELTRAAYRREIGGDHDSVIRAFLAASGLQPTDEAVEDYEDRFRSNYRRLLGTDFRATEGAREALAACRRQGRPLALVTSSEGWMAEIVLEELGGAGPFETVVTADDVDHEKPHPEAYLKARGVLERGGAERPLVAVEDTPSGVAAATGAGLPVIAVRHDLNTDHAFEDAAAVVDSLAPAEQFLELVDRVAQAGRAA